MRESPIREIELDAGRTTPDGSLYSRLAREVAATFGAFVPGRGYFARGRNLTRK